MKLFGNELIVAFDNKVKNMSNSKPSCSQEKNYKIIEVNLLNKNIQISN